MSLNLIRIGTRNSALALWQANAVADMLEKQGYQTELVPIKSSGDLNTDKALHELGTVGIFTKELDSALLGKRIDLAVHSLKDYPTQAAEGIALGAHLEREDPMDWLLPKGKADWYGESHSPATIATGSIRRKAQWLHRFPEHKIDNLRGNVQTRMEKLKSNPWNGIIMAAAGLKRLNSIPGDAMILDWMIPAPAQGVIGVTHRSDDQNMIEACAQIDVRESRITSTIERQFLRTLEGGCSAPIGALAIRKGGKIHFVGSLHSLDGRKAITIERKIPVENWESAGIVWGEEVLNSGGGELLKSM